MRLPSLVLLLAALAPALPAADGGDGSAARSPTFRRLDRDGDGRLTLDEFLAAWRTGGSLDPALDRRLRGQFARMDTDHDGVLSEAEFTAVYPVAGAAPAPRPAAVPATAASTPPGAATATTAAAEVARPKEAAPPAATRAAAPAGDDEKDEVDQNLARGVDLQPWSEYQRRSVENVLLPGATTVQEGHFHYRILHVAREVWYEDTTTNLLGLDDSVKIGLQLGYGITDRLDVNLLRSNGRPLQLATAGKPVNMDYYDLLFKYRLLEADDRQGALGGLADVSLVLGGTYMLRNRTHADFSTDLELVIERDLWSDRIRLGTGIAHAGLSAYEPILGLGPAAKLFPDETDAQGLDREANSTTAIPLTIKVAVSERWQVFAEAVFNFGGWHTDDPSVVTGARFNTHTHEYSFFFSNTANTAFNAVLTGGADRWTNLPVFGFSIVAHL